MSADAETATSLLEGFDWAGKIFSDGWVDAPETVETVEPATGESLGVAGVASAWKTSAPMRRHSEKVGAPHGTTMNSWKSTLLSACAPPLSTFIIGTGSTRAASPPR